MKQVMLMIGTRKGGFLAFSDLDRKKWEIKGPVLKGAEINHMNYLGLSSPVIFAAGKSSWWGSHLQISTDFGETWEEPIEGVSFAKERDLSVERIWVIESDLRAGRNDIYVGVDPGALFKSSDGGQSWKEIRSLTDDKTREKWEPGAGGLMVHSICVDPGRSERIYVAISAAGVFRSDDGGESWQPKNKGVRADFLPNNYPEVGQCPHHLEIHPTNHDILYQQNHCGVYRSENSGDDWIDICEGLPSRFGFPIAINPNDGDTIFVIPEESDEFRMTTDGSFRVYRSRNRGDTWEPLTNGLPQVNAYQNILRSAMTTDSLDSTGVYIGTQGGQLLASRDNGDHWEIIFNWLPPIYSLEVEVIEK